ncbi:ABC transporter substrate-binding protein [Pectobacterium versatile]|uniref:ABC transporter substrate-binding protein n=1 Tax=Pectobacterium versatile TaxID=2488639 RepID=UPI000B7BA9AE|nr:MULTISPECIES: ABC transporter substrate-binding protein [Pectobacterium]ASN84992.1 Iron ABC transporter substrate-binding protein [Pectobacterium versatile]MBQ4761725.1 extracellular solute-binding protein [Pectobacterium versatile]MCL6395982.1 ABC transporter substrate-binding protein [Pectobacterium carotovorum subsp. carotovorum]POY58834.1 iron ABC transporter substrate-binding protein [Pectobacterium versatile]POY62183.1 iron ABC transporter substrate-binding protein [Pectobacterium ver
MKLSTLTTLIAAGLTVAAVTTTTARAEGRLVIYCSATNSFCEEEAKAFGEKYNVKTSFIRNGSGSTLAKVDAEKKNPQADVWYGGTLDPQSQAGEMDLLEPYQSKNLDQIMPQFRDPAKRKGNYSSAVYVGILGFGVNTDRLKEKNLPVPQCWKDLTNPVYKGEIQIADPQSSGTAYTALATFSQLWGQDQAFDYLKKLNTNVSQYTKSGIAPARNAARGETAIGIGFLHDYSLEKEKGAPLTLISPCEGTGYEIGGVSILKGARNMDNAKLFVDWALSKEAQELSWKKGQSYQILTNTTAEASPLSLKLQDLKLINYDMDKYGAADVRKELISKWVNEVKMGQ